MRLRHYMMTLLMIAVLLIGMTVTASANEYKYDDGTCVFNGSDMKISYPSGDLKDLVKGLEPGDEVEFLVTYTNNSKYTTHWYMRNRVLETLEEAKSAAENGGYTYILQNIGPAPKKTRTTYFDNSEVGGEIKTANLEGLRQATNATTDYFFIQTLKPGKSGQTYIKVAFDGETEVNDYMLTQGGLDVAYAVEIEKPGSKTYESSPVTGDPFNLLKYILIMTAALILGVIAVVSWRKERKDGEKA